MSAAIAQSAVCTREDKQHRSRDAFLRASFSDPHCQTATHVLVTTGLDPVVHADVRLHTASPKLCLNVFAAWIAGSSPAMTKER
jgi:hypothetical protein